MMLVLREKATILALPLQVLPSVLHSCTLAKVYCVSQEYESLQWSLMAHTHTEEGNAAVQLKRINV